MQDEIQFRDLREDDYDVVVALWEQSDGIEVAEGDDRPSIANYLRRNPGLSRLALRGNQVIGAVLCGHDGRRGLIYHLAVAGEFRGRGIGQTLVRHCCDALRRQGLQRVIILMAKDNVSGREFWLRQSFQEIAGALPFGRDLV